MDAAQLRSTQALLRDHLAALKFACALGEDLERSLAACAGESNTMLPSPSPPPPMPLPPVPPPPVPPPPLDKLNIQKQPRAPDEYEGNPPRAQNGGASTAIPHNISSLLQPLLPMPQTTPVKRESGFLGHSASVQNVEIEQGRIQEKLRARCQSKIFADANTQDEEQQYRQEGCVQKLVLSRSFAGMQLAVIILNAIWVGVEVDMYLSVDSNSLVPIVINNLFCAFFVFELVLRFAAFDSTVDAFTQRTFVFDLLVVVTMIWDSVGKHLLILIGVRSMHYSLHLGFLRIFRLVRIARFANFSGNLPELFFYSTGIIEGVKATVPLLCLLALVVYVFGVGFTMYYSDVVPSFATVPEACHFLFLSALASIDKNFFIKILDAGWLAWIMFFVYTLIGNLTVAKMLTGVLLQVVQKIVQKEKGKSDTLELEAMIMDVASTLDTDGSGTIGRDEFEQLMEHESLLESMSSHDVDVAGFIDFVRTTFPVNGELFVTDLIRLAKEFCGFKPSSVKDIVNMRKILNMELTHIRGAIEEVRQSASFNGEAIQKFMTVWAQVWSTAGPPSSASQTESGSAVRI